MSHVTDVKLCVKDLDAVEETLAEQFPNLELRRNQKTYKWYESWVNDYRGAKAAVDQGHDPKDFGKCDHAIGIKGDKSSYEIGLVKRKDGEGWDMLWDRWGSGAWVERAMGTDASGFRREYAATVATRRAKSTLAKKGFKVERENLPGNKIRLKLRKR